MRKVTYKFASNGNHIQLAELYITQNAVMDFRQQYHRTGIH